MEYAILIYCEEDKLPDNWEDEAKREKFYEGYAELNKGLNEQEAFVTARRLTTTDTATTVQIRDDEVTVTDGPFAETKESLAGFYIIEAENLDAALAWAKKVPNAKIGSVEVRPILVYGG